jgi:hypothetical protein
MNTPTPQLTGAPPTVGEIFDERAPLIGAPAFFGPPVISVLGPWLLLVLLLIGPFALILTAMLALAVVAVLLAVLAMAIASPYLLIRHLHARGIRTAPPASPHLIPERRVSSGRLGSLQTKGMS